MLLVSVLLACARDPVEPVDCEVTQPIELASPETSVRLAQVLHLGLASPAEVQIVVDGVPWTAAPAAADHTIPLLGLGVGVHEVEASWTCGGVLRTAGPVEVALEMPEQWPELAVVVAGGGGDTLVTLRRGRDDDALGILDADGAPLWMWIAPDKVVDARLEPDGTVWMVIGGEVLQLDLLGNELARFAPIDGLGPFHHEVVPTGSGFLTLAYTTIDVDSFPVDVEDPDGARAPARLTSSAVVELDETGGVLSAFELADVLDTERVGWSSLDPFGDGLDWVHANAVAVDPVDGDLVVGVRNQDAVIELDRATGELQWILANPDGWSEPWASHRLDAEADFAWPFAAHAPRRLPDGGLLLFDNGNGGRTTPYGGRDPDATNFSRMVEYAIDEESGTVTQRWELVETAGGALFSPHFGDADRLEDGNRLGVWGAVESGGRLVEAALDGTVVWEVKLPRGWSMQRAQRLDAGWHASP